MLIKPEISCVVSQHFHPFIILVKVIVVLYWIMFTCFLLYILNKKLRLFDEFWSAVTVELWSAVTILNTHTIKSIHIDGLVQDCTNSIDNALALLQYCTKPLICIYLDVMLSHLIK